MLPKSPPNTAALVDSILDRVNVRSAQENWVAARDFLSLAVQLAPDQPQIRAALGSLQYRLQDYPAACVAFTSDTAQSPATLLGTRNSDRTVDSVCKCKSSDPQRHELSFSSPPDLIVSQIGKTGSPREKPYLFSRNYQTCRA